MRSTFLFRLLIGLAGAVAATAVAHADDGVFADRAMAAATAAVPTCAAIANRSMREEICPASSS